MAESGKTTVGVTITSTIDKMLESFEKLAEPPGFETIGKFESTLASMFKDTQSVVHVLSGGLKASGVSYSNFDGDSWSGTIDYARDPGIFELALGDKPSIDHPEGGHFFFDPAYDQLDKVQKNLEEWFDEIMGGE